MDGVCSSPGSLDDPVAHIIQNICVVATTAGQGVSTRASVQDIVARVAGEAVVQPIAGAVDACAARQDQVLDVR